jgi:glutamate racemase
MKFARQNIEFMLGMDVKLVLAACGSVSTVALPSLAPKYATPVLGVIEPAALECAALTKNGRIGIIATKATIAGGAFRRAVLSALPDAEIFDIACPRLVPLIEEGHINPGDGELTSALDEYLSPLKAACIDTLLLGCTHYPLVSDAISDYLSGGARLVGAAEAAVKSLCDSLGEKLSSGKYGGATYFTSGDTALFRRASLLFLDASQLGEIIGIEPFEL